MPAANPASVTIVGAGQAAMQVAQTLRRTGYAGPIVMFGDEDYLPYQRPPLSKAFLVGGVEGARLAFRPQRFFADQDIECRVGARVFSIDTAARQLELDGGGRHRFDALVIATGASPLLPPIPGNSLQGVHLLRGIDHAERLRDGLALAKRVLVIGGGYIGLEVAASARKIGRSVTVVERLPRLLSRVTCPAVSEHFLLLHREQGVDVRLGESVVECLGDQTVTSVTLESGEQIDADIVVIGVGVRPNDELAKSAGIECEDGILVDDNGRTSSPGVYAAGDCARTRLSDGSTCRLESVHNALDQGLRVASHIVSAPAPPYDPPWFWSDQYGVKLQTVGLIESDDEVVTIGEPGTSPYTALYFRDDRLVAVDAAGDPRSFMAGKLLLKNKQQVSREDVAQAGSLMQLSAGLR